MTDYYTPRKAVIIAGSRVGSTMLCNALDSHLMIGCDRSEPLNPITSPYLKAGLTNEQTLDIVLNRPGYHICACKVSYRQIRKQIPLTALVDLGVTKFIHLWRENPLRVVVSAALNTRSRREGYIHPTHAWETPPIQTIAIAPETVLMEGTLYLERVERMKAALQGYDALTLTYENLIFPKLTLAIRESSEYAIREFLGISTTEKGYFQTMTKPINPHPLSVIVENWSEICETLQGTILEKWIAE